MTSPDNENSMMHAKEMFLRAQQHVNSQVDTQQWLENRWVDERSKLFAQSNVLFKTACDFIDQRTHLEPLLRRIWELQTIVIPRIPDRIENIKPKNKMREILEKFQVVKPQTYVIQGQPERSKNAELLQPEIMTPPSPEELFDFVNRPYFDSLKTCYYSSCLYDEELLLNNIFQSLYWSIGVAKTFEQPDTDYMIKFLLKRIPKLHDLTKEFTFYNDSTQKKIFDLAEKVSKNIIFKKIGYSYKSDHNGIPQISFSCSIDTPSSETDNIEWNVHTRFTFAGKTLLSERFQLGEDTTNAIGIALSEIMITSLHIDSI